MEIQDKYPVFDYDPKKIRGYLFSDKCPDYVSGEKYLNIAEKKARNWRYISLFDKNRDLFYKTILNYWPRIWKASSYNLKYTYNVDLSNIDDVKKIIEQAKKEYRPFDGGDSFSTLYKAFEIFLNTICSEIADLKRELNHLLATEQIPKECSASSQSKVQKETNNGLDVAKNTRSGRNCLRLKFQCSEDSLESIGKAFQKLADLNILKLPENFNISDYFSVRREGKNRQTLLERIDWTRLKGLPGFVAFIEILEEKYNLKMNPIQVRATFKYHGENITDSYETYKSSKPAPHNSFKKRESIERHKAELREILD